MLDALRGAAAVDPWFAPLQRNLEQGSPTAACVSLEYLRRCRLLGLDEVLALDRVVAQQCQRHPDFPEGVRALLIDKTRDAAWSPPRLEEVTQARVDGFFVAPVDDAPA